MNRLVTLKSLWLGDDRRLASDGPEASALPSFATPMRATTFKATRLPDEKSSPASVVNFESRRELRDHLVWRAWTPPEHDYVDMQATLGKSQVWIEDGAARHIAATGTLNNREASWTVAGRPMDPPYDLRLVGAEVEMALRIPANVRRVWARVDRRSRERCLVYSFRLESVQPACDAILNYLRRGDVAAATAMEDWIDQSKELLFGKMDDPYAAAVSGYLLLKLERFDVLQAWAKTLADNFSHLPDGCVLWASQLARQEPVRIAEIRSYFALAVQRGLPVYTEGLRLLMDGLRLLGPSGETLREDLRAQVGEMLWKSPVTAAVSSRFGRVASGSIAFDIEFGSRV